MKRDVCESISTAIEALESFDLRFAEVALSVKDHDVCIGKLVRIGQFVLLYHEF